MGTGIVSIALSLDGQKTLSQVLLGIAAGMWLTLAVLVALRVRRDRPRFLADIRTPPALSAVAATEVLGTRIVKLGWTSAAIALLAIAAVIWALLVPVVLKHWKTPTVGASLMLTVATESLAVLPASLAAREHADWLLVTALVPFALGLCFYVFAISRFDLRQLRIGRGDHWITGGALAISTLAAGRLATGARSLAILGNGGVLQTVAVVLWVLTMLWLPVLVAAEMVRPRWGYDVRRWATVFPVGMYAACSFVVGIAATARGITDFARVWVWVSLALWLVVFGAMLGRAPGLVRAPTG